MIGYPSLAVALRVVWDEKLVGNLVLGETLATCLLAKFIPLSEMMVCETQHDTLPKEFYCLLPRDIGDRHHFYPLGEVVIATNRNLTKVELREEGLPLEPPLYEGPGTSQIVVVLARSVRESESLTLLTLFYVLFGIIKHLGPIISLIDDLAGKGSALDMVLTVASVDLLHYPPGFVGPEAPQVWVRVQFGV